MVFEHAPIPMWVYDRTTLKFLAVNAAAIAHYGYTQAEFLRMCVHDLVALPDGATGSDGASEQGQRHRAKHGAVFVVRLAAFDLVFAGRPARLAMVNDMTMHQQLEHEREALMEREQHAIAALMAAVAHKDETVAVLDSLLATAPIGFAFLDPDLRYVRINAALARINGLSMAEHVGRTVHELFPRMAPMVQQVYDQISATGEPVLDVPLRSTPSDAPGEQRDYLLSYYPVRIADDRVLGMGALVLDVTARIRAEHEREQMLEQLHLERSRLEATLQQMPGGLIIAQAPRGYTLLANQQATHIFGYRFDPQRPQAIEQFNDGPFRGFHADGRLYEPHEWPLARAVEHGEIVEDEEMDVVRADGSRISVRANAAPIRDSAGQIIAGVVAFQDVSARKHAEAALKRSEERLRTLVTNVPLILFALDHAGVMTLSEGKGLTVLGVAPGEAVGKTVWELYHDVPAVLDDVRRALQGDALTGVRDVHGIIFETSYSPLRDDTTGAVVGVIGVAIDVTERTRAERALRASEERLRLALDVSQMGTWDWDIATGAFTWSAQLERLCGYAPGTMPRTYDAFLGSVHPDDRDHVHHLITLATNNGEHHAEFRVVWADGSEHWIANDGQVMYDAGKQPVRMIGVSRDITERKRADVERASLLEHAQGARRDAEQALNIREQFLSVASHELKTPLTSLMAYSSILQKRVRQGQPLGQRESRAVDVIAQQTTRLHTLVDALFDLSRIETGQLALQHEKVDLAALAQRVVNDTQTTLTVRHRLHFVRPRHSVFVQGDEMRLEQVLQNLLQNAIKYSPDGGIVTVRLQHNAHAAWLAVSDQGIGIPDTARAQLFQRFFRAANVRAQQISGIGIGLYVAHEIVRRHGGTISVESRENEGATFTVRLPLAGNGG